MEKRQNLKTACGALLCCLLWGLAFPFTGILYDGFCPEGPGIGTMLLMAGVRFTGAGLLLLALAALRGMHPLKSLGASGRLGGIAVLGLVETGAQYALFYLSMNWLSGDRASLVNTTNAFFSVILAHFFCPGDRMNFKKFLGCLSGTAGIGFLLGGSGAGVGIGDVLMLLSALSFSAGNVLCRHLGQETEPTVLTAWQMLIGGAALLAAGGLSGGSLRGGTAAAWLLMVLFVLQSASAFAVWNRLLSRNNVSAIGIYTCLIPVIGVLFTALLEGTAVSGRTLVSLLLVAGGVLIINCPSLARKKPEG